MTKRHAIPSEPSQDVSIPNLPRRSTHTPATSSEDAPGASARVCRDCCSLGAAIVAAEKALDVGRWRVIRKPARCRNCQRMKKLMFETMPPGRSKFKLSITQHPGLSPEYALEPTLTNRLIPLAPLDYGGSGDARGILVNPAWIDIGRIQTWLRFCDEHHGETCHGLPAWIRQPSAKPSLLLDVVDGRLVETAELDARYLALSYVWGGVDDGEGAVETRQNNLEAFKKHGSITAETGRVDLPQTVRDAIRLVKSLGERFLWVDRLCIVQDDARGKRAQINAMGSIYANARCTIVAAGGDSADAGILGVGAGSAARNYPPQTVLDFHHCRMLCLETRMPHEDSAWSSRGWTFQEQLLSRRVLIFGGGTVVWKCQACLWREDVTAEPDAARPRAAAKWQREALQTLRMRQFPDMLQWTDLVSEYCTRNLKFDGDAREAFAGVEEILGHSFPGGFCFGLPEFYFDLALLWQPRTPIRRREVEEEGRGGGADHHDDDDDDDDDAAAAAARRYLPSWSWMGWHGRLDPLEFGFDWLATVAEPDSTDSRARRLEHPSWRHLSPVVLVNRSSAESWFADHLKIMPLAHWAQRGPAGAQRVIRNDYDRWRRETVSETDHPNGGGDWRHVSTSNSHFAHPSAPKVQFRHPVPLGPHGNDGVAAHRQWPPHLRLRSQRAYFRVSIAVFTNQTMPDMAITVALTDQAGAWAGVLRLNTDDIGEVPDGQVCELVAISRGIVDDNTRFKAKHYLEEWDMLGKLQSKGYEFYNVLWVRRQEGWFVREALGRIEKSVWDAQELEDVDVELR